MTNRYAQFIQANQQILIEEHRRGCHDEDYLTGFIQVDAAMESCWFYPAMAIESDFSWAVEAADENELWVEFLGDAVYVKFDLRTGSVLQIVTHNWRAESLPELPEEMQ